MENVLKKTRKKLSRKGKILPAVAPDGARRRFSLRGDKKRFSSFSPWVRAAVAEDRTFRCSS